MQSIVIDFKMASTQYDINLKDYKSQKSTVFTGRPQGEEVRKTLKLSEKEVNGIINFSIPEDTTSFNPSFYLGLLYESIKKLGIEKFNSVYHFNILTTEPEKKALIVRNLADGYRNAVNMLNKNFNFNSFFETPKS